MEFTFYNFVINSCCPLSHSRSNPIDNSSMRPFDVNKLYMKKMLRWLISPKCYLENNVNLKLLNKAIGPKLINYMSSPFTYLFLSDNLITSKFKSR